MAAPASTTRTTAPATTSRTTAPARIPGLVAGLGLGGFLDGIVLHQLLQWHHMVSSQRTDETVAGLEANTLADGVFHAVTLALTVAGVGLVWRAARAGRLPDAPHLLVLILAGWGAFNVADTLNHWPLGLHHIRPGEDQTAWDLGFLALGLAQLVAGLGMARARERRLAGGT